jgi:O-succinylbenzoate synthase
MGLHLAAAIPDLEFDCGLGTAALLAADVTDAPLLPIDGELAVRRVDVASAILEKHTAAPERREWWVERVGRCHRVLERAGE